MYVVRPCCFSCNVHAHGRWRQQSWLTLPPHHSWITLPPRLFEGMPASPVVGADAAGWCSARALMACLQVLDRSGLAIGAVLPTAVGGTTLRGQPLWHRISRAGPVFRPLAAEAPGMAGRRQPLCSGCSRGGCGTRRGRSAAATVFRLSTGSYLRLPRLLLSNPLTTYVPGIPLPNESPLPTPRQVCRKPRPACTRAVLPVVRGLATLRSRPLCLRVRSWPVPFRACGWRRRAVRGCLT